MILVSHVLSAHLNGPERYAWPANCYDNQPPPSPFTPSVGKSALHWAAAVNNVEAAVVLLKNGANKDMQDNKVCEVICLKCHKKYFQVFTCSQS